MRRTYTYGEQGKRLNDLVEVFGDGAWESESRVSYEYTADGAPRSATTEQWAGGQWVNRTREVNTYNAEGRLTLASAATLRTMRRSGICTSFDISQHGFQSPEHKDIGNIGVTLVSCIGATWLGDTLARLL